MHPRPRTIHGTPHELPTAVSCVSQAQATDLQHLLTDTNGEPRQRAAS